MAKKILSTLLPSLLSPNIKSPNSGLKCFYILQVKYIDLVDFLQHHSALKRQPDGVNGRYVIMPS